MDYIERFSLIKHIGYHHLIREVVIKSAVVLQDSEVLKLIKCRGDFQSCLMQLYRKDILIENAHSVQSSASSSRPISFWREFDSRVVQGKEGVNKSGLVPTFFWCGLNEAFPKYLSSSDIFIWKWPTDDISHISEQVSDMMEGLPVQKSFKVQSLIFPIENIYFMGFGVQLLWIFMI